MLSEVTRRDIIDILEQGYTYTTFEERPHPDHWHYQIAIEHTAMIDYHGRLEVIEFLKRLYELDKLPSHDRRYEDDIRQHTVFNQDYSSGWVFEDARLKLAHGNEDHYLLDFLCEMFHPAVRDDRSEWQMFIEKINELINVDGYEIYPSHQISRRDVYKWRLLSQNDKIVAAQIDDIKTAFGSDYVRSQVDIMHDLIYSSPSSAIGKAKELIEICCKSILNDQDLSFDDNMDLIQLMNMASSSIGLTPKTAKGCKSELAISGRILGNLCNISQGMAELRNLYGDGHGKSKEFKSLPPRYAHLAVGASVAVVHFMWETYQEKKKKEIDQSLAEHRQHSESD